ncbi:MAG: thiamine diphosphokinase [Ignavibacteria bacterium]|nr:thiamine diphosphokinase [Ignavibacteria bacterium]
MNPFSRLQFSISGFDALVCLDGVLPFQPEFYEHFTTNSIIAADGASLQLRSLGVTPGSIIGDLDSFYLSASNEDFPNSSILYSPDQETNDFEKCLAYCLKLGITSVLICGFHGGLLEHSLNNWSVFIRYSKIMDLCIYESNRYSIPLHQSIVFSSNSLEIISLIPQTSVRVTTQGLQWELSNEWLSLGTREGARNRAIAEDISIEIHEGSLLFICDERFPQRPVFTQSIN